MLRSLRSFLICLALAGCSSLVRISPSPEFAIWSAFKSPTLDQPKIYGTYQKGCIAGAKQLPLEGTGYFVVRRNRERYYGHPTLVNYLIELGQKIQKSKAPSMIIEDLSYPRGGPFLKGHNSHQIGLDVDISLKSVRAPPTEEESLNWTSPSYVEDRKTLLPTWGQEQIQLTELAASSTQVNRIFVAPAIKKYFCVNKPEAAWLYKLRSWWGHDDHLHVRLNCPASSPDCVSQTPLDPKNNGCGTELEWWYSAEADADWQKMQQQFKQYVREFPTLPAACETVKAAN